MSNSSDKPRYLGHIYASTAAALLALCLAPWKSNTSRVPLVEDDGTISISRYAIIYEPRSLFSMIEINTPSSGSDEPLVLVAMVQLILVLVAWGAISKLTARSQWIVAASAWFTVAVLALSFVVTFEKDVQRHPIVVPAASLLIALAVAVTASRHARRLSTASRTGRSAS